MTDEREPAVVATAPDPVGGEIVACALQSAGIPAQVRSTRRGLPYPGVRSFMGPVSVVVPAALEADARAILAELEATEGSRGVDG